MADSISGSPTCSPLALHLHGFEIPAQYTLDLTESWPAAGRIFEFVHGSGANPPVITPANLPPIVETLLAAIKDEHHIAEKVPTVCLALLMEDCSSFLSHTGRSKCHC